MSERDGPDPVMLGLLELAVPAWIDRVRMLSPAEQEARRAAAVELIAHGADALVRKAKAGKAAAQFNAIAEGLALLALCPGGVTWCGMHWEARA